MDNALKVLAVLWFVAAGVGMRVLQKYEASPGTMRGTPKQWPAASRIEHPANQPFLLMFAHPKCPCTRASIEELNRLLARTENRVGARVLFFQPLAAVDNWTNGPSWELAAKIPGVKVEADLDGAEARRFGAQTSGFVVLYDALGKLVFRGGITAARGHVGDNAGSEAVITCALRGSSQLSQTPVFGCGLMEENVLPANQR